MYRCISKSCDENVDYSSNSHQDIILYGREKELAFRSRILLSCGHSVCEKCVYFSVTTRNEEFVKCEDCGKTTNFSRQTISTIKANRPGVKECVRWNEDCEDDLLYEAFSIGAAFNSGRVSVAATPIVDLDESINETNSLSRQVIRNDPEVYAVREKISGASDSYKSLVTEGIQMYHSCGKSLQFLIDTRTAVNKQFVSTKEAIRKRFHVLHGLLQLEEANFIKELVKSKENTLKSLQEKEKTIDTVRNSLKNCILRRPKLINIQSTNPLKAEIVQCRSKPLRIDLPPELPNYLTNLNRPHDELLNEVRKLVDFRKAVRFDVNISFSPLLSTNRRTTSAPAPVLKAIPSISSSSSSSTSNSSSTPSPTPPIKIKEPRKKIKPNFLSYIDSIVPCSRQQLVTIHDVKDSGYFSAHLPSDPSVSTSLAKEIEKWCNTFRHPPCISKIKPSCDIIVWHDQRLNWIRAKVKRLIEDHRQTEKENYFLLDTNIVTKRVEVILIDYGDEIYETPIENIRESCTQLTDPATYPSLLKVWKCRLKNIQPLSSNLRAHILKFCPNDVRVRLLILSEPIEDIYDVDVVHNINDLVNPYPTLIEFLIYNNVAKLRNSAHKYPYPSPPIHLQYRDPATLKIGEVYSVDVTAIRNPHEFSIVISREQNEIERLEHKINELMNSQQSISLRLYYPRLWVPCTARCHLFYDKKKNRGKMFHRGYIITIPDQPGSVVFHAVDYGETVPVNISEIRILPDCFVSALHKAAIKCSLGDIIPLDSATWSDNAINRFKEFFEAPDTPTVMTVKGCADKKHNVILNLHKVKSHQPDGNISENLIKDKFAIKKSKANGSSNTLRDNPLASSSSNSYRPTVSRIDFNCYSLLHDLTRKFKARNLGPIDSLIPVIISAFNSPDSFYIQINTPEVQSELNNYMKRITDEYGTIGLDRRPVGPMQSFEVGEQCIYLLRSDCGFSSSWRRGIILEFLDQGRSSSNSFDPRQSKQVSPDSMYKLRDRDYGVITVVERKDMLQLQPSSPYRRDGDKCLQIYIPGIKPSGENWSFEALDLCKTKLRTHFDKLFLKIEEYLTASPSEKIPADCIYLSTELVDACSPSEDHYYSLRYQLLSSGSAALISETSEFEKEIRINNDSVFANISIPFAIHDDNVISSLRSSFYGLDRLVEPIKYIDAQNPTVNEFDATCTHIDDGLIIWFTIKDGKNLIGTINKTILRTIMKKERLIPFTGSADEGRACTVYCGSRWYRAEILSSANNKITVRHVDTGACKEYYVERMSSETFCEGIPKLAFAGRLDKCAPYTNRRADTPARLKEFLVENLVGKDIRIKWENFGSPRQMLISVLFGDEGRDLKSVLLNKDLVQETSCVTELLPHYIRNSLEIIELSEFSYLDHQFVLNKTYPVIIADYITENYLYVQLVNFDKVSCPEENEVNALYEVFQQQNEHMNQCIDSYCRAIEFNVGNSCCAKWNDEWFRGIVTAIIIPRVKYQVFFIDWGNTDIVDFTDMKILPASFTSRDNPIYGFFVRCSNIKPARQGVWSPRLNEMMKTAIDEAATKDTPFLIRFKSTTLPFDVELWIADNKQQPAELFFADLINDRFLESC